MRGSDRLVSEARQARAIAANLDNRKFREMLLELAERLEKKAEHLAAHSVAELKRPFPAVDGSVRASIQDGPH